MEFKEIISERHFKAGYVIKKGIVDGSEFGTEDMEMCAAETPDGHYIGDPKWAHRLCKTRGIKPEKADPGHSVCSIGFCEREQKWYGWSHRAIYGFGIGSKVVKGDCAYVADTPEGLIDSHATFFSDISAESEAAHRAECQVLPDRSGIRILHTPLKIPVDIMEGFSEVKCGRGEWTAKTLEDARQMACDFAEGVS